MTESELDEVVLFLRAVFSVNAAYPMFQPALLSWKCFAPHPFWEGSRGYALRHKGEIAAFGCLVPCRFLTGSATVISCCMIDWAASQKVPGAGVMLYRQIQALAGTMINIGGSADARSVLPRMGFEGRLSLATYTRVLRPFRHVWHAPKDWKSPLRWARDCRELLRSVPPGGLRARRIATFDSLPPNLFPDPAITGNVVCERTAASLNYSLACPAAQMEAYALDRDAAPTGYFLLSRVGSHYRIADIWVSSDDLQHWTEAYAAATIAAAADAGTTEVTTAASTPLQIQALRQAGYRRTQAEPVFVLDPAGALKGRQDLAISYLENDAYYWHSEA